MLFSLFFAFCFLRWDFLKVQSDGLVESFFAVRSPALPVARSTSTSPQFLSLTAWARCLRSTQNTTEKFQGSKLSNTVKINIRSVKSFFTVSLVIIHKWHISWCLWVEASLFLRLTWSQLRHLTFLRRPLNCDPTFPAVGMHWPIN